MGFFGEFWNFHSSCRLQSWWHLGKHLSNPCLEPKLPVWKQFFSLLLSENSMSKKFLHCVQWKYVISTENITLMSLLVMFTLEISNRNLHPLFCAFALYQGSGRDLAENQHDKCSLLPLSHPSPQPSSYLGHAPAPPSHGVSLFEEWLRDSDL